VRLDGGQLEVEVEEDLHIDLTGWAVSVYRGELSDADAVFAQGVGE
jgi:diaminopimelate epimerase